MNHSKWEDVRIDLARRHWERVVEAMKAEPQCEIRDGVLRDMAAHEPTLHPELRRPVCRRCSNWFSDHVVLVNVEIAPCWWIQRWAERLEVDQ